MKLRLSECDYEYIRPPKEVFDVTHTDYYIKHGDGKKAVRKIFEDIKYPDEELEKLREFEALVAKENIALPANWTKIDNIKMMYAGKFDFKKCIKLMRAHTEWRASPDRGDLSPGAHKILQDGILYISGRDKQFRPLIVLNVYKIDLKTMELPMLIEALNFVMDVCIKFYFVPGKVENWVFIIETNGVGIINFPFKVIKTVNEATAVNYTSRLDKLYIMNPSPFLGASWKMIHGFLDPETASKIFMLKKSEFGKLLESIDKDQLEKCYGGNLEYPKPHWPPTNTLNKPPYPETLKKEIEITKAQAAEAMKFTELVHQQQVEEVKHQEAPRSKRNSATYDRNSPEIVVKAEQSSPDEQKFAKAARPGQTLEDEHSRISASPDMKEKMFTDAKALVSGSPIQGMIRENVRRSSQQLDEPVHKEQPSAQAGYTVNIQHAKTLEAGAFDEVRFEGEGQGQDTGRKVDVKRGASVTFAGVDVSDGHDNSVKGRNDGIVLEGNDKAKSQFCGFCRPNSTKTDEEEQANQESNRCNMF